MCWNNLLSGLGFFVCLQYNANGPNLKKKARALPHPNFVQGSMSARVLWERLPVSGVSPCGVSIPFALSCRPRCHLLTLKSSSRGIPLVGWVDLKGAAFHHVPLVTAE